MSIARSLCKAMERIAPLRLAEKWDNVCVQSSPPCTSLTALTLAEAPGLRPNASRILLTIDLTTEVAEEALATPTCAVVSYHPTIFRPVASLTLDKPLQASILHFAASNVSLFCPHTSLDSVNGGINDWLAQGIIVSSLGVRSEAEVTYLGEAYEDLGGQCRLVTFAQPVAMTELQKRVKKHLNLQHIQVGYPTGTSPDQPTIRTVAICAGAGASSFAGKTADLYFTGEMAHHEVLAAVARGTNVILCGHTNTERGYLPTLAEKLRQSLQDVAGEEANAEHALVLRSLEVVVSTKDRHPLQII